MKYTIKEFRKNTREILNAVDQGAEVIITRYDQEYVISPNRTGTFVVDPEFKNSVLAKVKPGREVLEGQLVSTDDVDILDKDSTILENGKVVKKIVVQAQNKKVTPKQQKLDRAVAAETGLCEHFQKKGQCMVKGCKYGR